MEEKEILRVQMLGGFAMTYGGKTVQVGKKQTARAVLMLQALLYAGEAGLSRNQIVEYTFGRDPEGDIANNLSVTVYHLRRLLKESILPKEPYISIKGGRYRFVSSYPVEVDVQALERLAQETRQYTGEKRINLLREACNLYKGHFLPAQSGEEWVMIAGIHYQQLYANCLEELCTLLKERREYEEIMKLSSHAAALYPFDEWQVWQMECLLALKRQKEALALYDETAAMYFEELAIPPSERMTEFFERMGSRIQLEVSDFNEIQMELMEDEKHVGAYYCLYPSFVDSYHMTVRMMERSGQSVYLMLCTILDEHKKQPEDQKRMKMVSDHLKEAIQEALRRGDVFTRYSANQFLVLLAGITKEECPIAINRIDVCFRQKENSRRIRVSYRTISVECVQEEEEVWRSLGEDSSDQITDTVSGG